MKIIKKTLLIISLAVLSISCSDDENDPIVPKGDYENGFFITNEGPFQNGSGTLTFVSVDQTVTQNVYKTVNSEDLGNILQSMTFVNDKAYIIVNNSQKIVVADRYTMEKITTIEGADVVNPRNFVVVGDKAYVSDWGDAFDATDDFVSVIDLNSNTVTTTIPVGLGPEDMLIKNDLLYVNLQGAYGQNNQVTIIDTMSDVVLTSLEVGDVPNSITEDASGNIWVLCEGKPSYADVETAGKLIKIVNDAVDETLEFTISDHPSNLTIYGSDLYYTMNGKVLRTVTTDTTLTSVTNDVYDGSYYSLKAANGFLYATDAKDYSSEGSLKIFNLTTNAVEATITTGIIPNSVVFQN